MAEVTPEEEVGNEVHAQLIDAFGLETEAWATERVARVMEALNRVRLSCPEPGAAPRELVAEILWLQGMNAFTLPGHYVYLSRRLLERTGSDDSVAFALAHEAAHQDLGHVRLLTPMLSRFGKTMGTAIGAVVRLAERVVYSPEQERAADAYALDLSLAAGYRPDSGLTLFSILEQESLDLRDIEGVFGPDTPSKLWEKLRGYPSIHQRKDELIARLRREYGLSLSNSK
ncbi:MAG: M48 family metallopeptidase [Armatimonas sp.]